MTDKIRLGFVGANVHAQWASQSHYPALLASPDVELTAVCTTRQESAEEAREALGARLAFSDWREMVLSPDIDAVAVVVRVPEHYGPTRAALEAGKHVYTEWPLGRTTAEAEDLAGLARAAGVQTVVGLQSRVSPTLMQVKALLESGYLGEVLSVHVGGFRVGYSRLPLSRTWQADASNGANTLTIAFGHVVDALRFVAGDFARVRSLVTTQSPHWYATDTQQTVEATSPDNVLISGSLVSGAVASVHVGAVPWAGSGFRMQVFGREGTLDVTGSVSSQRGETLQLRAARGTHQLVDMELEDRFSFVPRDFPCGDPFNVGQMYSLFAESIRGGRSVAPTFETAVGLHRFLDAVRQSSDAGQEVRLV
ncbi:MAG: Gfo/Idh/MocA family oxidoreductase [Chloroflexi bacterium]|nr:Gfo/Idh/MocA family oxidoreductase [Chloroflexota bacterium]